MFEFSLDTEARIVRVVTSGFWTVEQAREFANQYRDHVRQARQRWGVALILVDARGSALQSADVTAQYSGLHAATLEDPRDRVAVVVMTNLIKMQTSRVLEADLGSAKDSGGVFLSPEAAETWLRVDQG